MNLLQRRYNQLCEQAAQELEITPQQFSRLLHLATTKKGITNRRQAEEAYRQIYALPFSGELMLLKEKLRANVPPTT